MKTPLLKFIFLLLCFFCLLGQNSFAQTITCTNNTGFTTSSTLRNGAGVVTLYGVNMTVSSNLTLGTLQFSNTNGNANGYFASGQLYRSTSGTRATAILVPGASVAINGSDVTVTGFSQALVTGTTYTYYLDANVVVTFGSLPSTIRFGMSFVKGPGYSPDYTLSGTALGTIYTLAKPDVTVANLTSGITTGTLTYGQTGIVVFGFSVTVTGALTANQFTVTTATDAQSIFTNARLFRSTTSTSYPTGFGTSIATGTINATNTRFSYTENFPGATTTVNYFVVVDYTGTCPTPSTVQFAISNGQSPAFIIGPSSVDYPSTNSILGTNYNIAKTMNWIGGSSAGSFTDLNNFATICGGAPSSISQYDVVQIGVNSTNFTYSPFIAGNSTVGKLIFGNNKSANFSLTGGGILTVTDGITLQNGASTTFSSGPGSGSISISSTSAVSTLNSSSTLNIAVPLTNAGSFSVPNGSTLSSTSTLTNSGTITEAGTGAINVTGASTNSGTISQTGTGAVTFSSTLDNTNIINQSSTGTLTVTGAFTNGTGDFVNQTGTGVLAFNSITNAGTISQTSTGTLNATGAVVNNSGGTITLGGGPATFGNTITNNNGGTISLGSGGIKDFNGATFANTGTITQAGSIANIAATTFTNTNPGTFIAASGTVNFDAAATQNINSTNTTTPITFHNLILSGGNFTKTLNQSGATGKFQINSTGSIEFTSTNTKLTAGTASLAHLTLKSDANGSSNLKALLTGNAINGFVNVERYFTGGSANSRGYRLMSSPVSVSSASLILPNLTYISANAYTTGTGGATNGFDVAGNPTLYFYRENLVPNGTSFLTGNYRGVKTINNTSTFTMDIDAGNFDLPAGNGFLFFFRGNRASNATTNAAAIAQTATFTNTGYLNQGTITVRHWTMASGTGLLNTSAGTASVKGFNLVGNPYASSINWDGSGITSTNIGTTIWVYNPKLKVYATYIKGDSGNGTNFNGPAANIIPSGQGFFVRANNPAPSITFTEAAKVTNQVTSTSLLMSTGTVDVVEPLKLLRVQIYKDSLNREDALIFLKNNSKEVFVVDEDAEYLRGNNVVTMSTTSADKKNLAINSIPLPKKTATILPLNANITTTGLYQISLTEAKNIPALYEVYLKDALKKDSLDVLTHSTYNFNATAGDSTTFGTKRFSLVIRQKAGMALKLLDFAAAKVTLGAELSWITENESNYTNFTVERSIDGGKTYEVIGGLQSTALGKYTLMDKGPVIGQNMYRLKQDDVNGTISYSKVVTLMYSTKAAEITVNNITVYPNPASSFINVGIVPQSNATSYNIRITNGVGLVVRSATTSQTTWQDNVSNLLPGTYFVQVTVNNTKAIVGNGRFIKN